MKEDSGHVAVENLLWLHCFLLLVLDPKNLTGFKLVSIVEGYTFSIPLAPDNDHVRPFHGLWSPCAVILAYN